VDERESEVRIHFGKHKGSTLEELPDHYLTWLVEESDIYYRNLKLFKAASDEAKSRSEAPAVDVARMGFLRCARQISYLRKERVKLVENFVKEMYYG